jgi:protoheme IX farnesyltransferase
VPVLGWAAITGTVHPHALLLFLIIFTWTPPHFWALAIERHKEYAEVDVPMLPVTHGVEYTRLQVLLYTILLLVVSVLPFVFGMSGPLYLAGALLLGAVFMYYAVLLKWAPRPGLPMRTFGYSIVYLMGIFTVLFADHYLR